MFNLWRTYPRWRPKSDGFYLCTVRGIEGMDDYVLILYYSCRSNTWIDIRRQKVFDGYVVYRVCRAAIPENHVSTDSLCDRTDDVVAWKKLPKVRKRK